MFDFGILGINARNLQYIKKFNPKKAIRLADNKLKTKRFLSARGIPVPETYDIIKDRKTLYSYDFGALPVEEFIVKPVRGSRGRGIYRVKRGTKVREHGIFGSFSLKDIFLGSHDTDLNRYVYKILGERIDDTTFRRYLVDILDGKNSLTSRKDTIMLEEVLVPGSGFEQFCARGLADIRIIVFNLIPVACMLRIPTKESNAKANLDRGAVGMGVEVGSGKIYSIYHQGKIYTRDFPQEYASFAHKYLPYRSDILLYSSKIQYFVNLGYLALDWVITNDGPKLLEINARAGLKFQNVAVLPLKKRLNRIKDIHITSPEKGVEIAQTLFSKQRSQIITSSKVVYLSQPAQGVFHYVHDDAIVKKVFDITLKINTEKKRNYASSYLFQKYKKENLGTYIIKCDTSGIQFKNLPLKEDERLPKDTLVLGREAVSEYYIKPITKSTISFDFINPKYIHKTELDSLQILDKRLAILGRILNMSRILKPSNFLEELDSFITQHGNYNPVFRYRRPSDKKLDEVHEELKYLKKKYFEESSLESTFAFLFSEKIDELLIKVKLLKAYKKQKYEKIQKGNEALFGSFDESLFELAKNKIFESKRNNVSLGRVLKPREMKQKIIAYLRERGLEKIIKVRFDQDAYARIMVTRGKNIVMKISPQAKFREYALQSIMAHEIDVHVMRHLAGEETGRNILKSGTARYMIDEEGLAILKSEEYLPKGYEKLSMYYKYFFMYQARYKDFASLASLMRGIKGYSLIASFKATLRIKKGLHFTSTTGNGTVYMKDKIYLDGYMKVKKWIEKGGNKNHLMIGKVKIEDLDLIV